MTKERKQILLELLPRESPYSVELYRQRDDEWKIPAEVNAMAEACHDPAFGQKFIDSFLVLKRPLPATVVETELVRAYCYLRYGNSDPDVQAALALEHDSNRTRRIMVKCMLLRAEYDYAAIGQKTRLSEATVRIYHDLQWAIRERDRIYVASLLYPNGTQCELEPDYAKSETVENLACRLAFHHGIEPVEAWLGIGEVPQKASTHQEAEAWKARVLSKANFLSKMGFLHQDWKFWKTALAVLRLSSPPRERAEVRIPVQQAPPGEHAIGLVDGVTVSESLNRNRVALDRLLSSTEERVSAQGTRKTREVREGVSRQAGADPETTRANAQLLKAA